MTWQDHTALPIDLFPTDENILDINPVDATNANDLLNFHLRVRVKMIVKKIENSLTAAS